MAVECTYEYEALKEWHWQVYMEVLAEEKKTI